MHISEISIEKGVCQVLILTKSDISDLGLEDWKVKVKVGKLTALVKQAKK